MGAFIATYFYNKPNNHSKHVETIEEEEEKEKSVAISIDGIDWVDPIEIPTIQYNVQPSGNMYTTEAPKI